MISVRPINLDTSVEFLIMLARQARARLQLTIFKFTGVILREETES